MTKFATVIFLLSLFSTSQGQWVETAAFPGGATDGCYSFSINNRVYVGGGLVPHRLYEYKSDGTWADLGSAAAGGERAWAFAFTIGDNAYVCGGANGGASNLTKDLWEFNSITKTWTQRAEMPAARDGGCAFSVGGKGYVGCGFDGTYMVSDFYEYDPATDQWRTLNPYPEALIFPSAFVIEGKAYVVGGAGATETASLYRYEPDEDSWAPLSSFPGELRQAGSAFVLGQAGYYGGGMQSYTTNLKDIWRYDASTDVWSNTNAELPTEFTAWQTAAVGGPASGSPEWAVFVAGASLSGGELKMSSKAFRFSPALTTVPQKPAETMMLYPNPVSKGNDVLFRGLLSVQFVITDVIGREVLRGSSDGGRINCSSLSPGIYSIVLEGPTISPIISSKLVIQ